MGPRLAGRVAREREVTAVGKHAAPRWAEG